MSNVKQYDVGQIRFDLFETNNHQQSPYMQYTHELPLLALGDIDQSLNISLIFNYQRYRDEKANNENPFFIAPGFKLNLHKRMTCSQLGVFTDYQEENGKIVQLNNFGGYYSFDDESQRTIKQQAQVGQTGSSSNGNEIFDGNSTAYDYFVQYSDFRKEKFNAYGRIMAVYDKYSDNAILSYSYLDDGRLSSVQTQNGKVINFSYDINTNLLTSITYNNQCISFIYDDNVENSLLSVQNHLGVKYTIFLTKAENHTAVEIQESDYKIEATSDESTEPLYSKELKLRGDGYTVDIVDINHDDNIVNINSYTHPDHLIYMRSNPHYVDVTDRNGVTTRVQVANHKVVCAYEIKDGEPQFDVQTQRFLGNVTLYNTSESSDNNQACGTQSTFDGLLMGHTVDSARQYWSANVSVGDTLNGYYTISGWVKSSDTNISGDTLYIGNNIANNNPHQIFFKANGQWQYFSIMSYIEANTVYACSIPNNNIEFCDVRLTYQGTGVESEDDSSHTAMTEYVLLDGNVEYPFRNAQFKYSFYGEALAVNGVTPSDVMKCKLKKFREGVLDEVYFNNSQGVRPGASDLNMVYRDDDDDDDDEEEEEEHLISIHSLDLGIKAYSGGKTGLTKFHVIESDHPVLIKTCYVDGVLISTEKLDTNLDVIESTTDGITTEYVRDNRGRIIIERVAGLYEHQTVYDYETGTVTIKEIDPSTNAAMNSKKYYIDNAWGVVTKVEALDSNGTVRDMRISTFDDACNTVVSTAFDNMLIGKHSYAYSKGRLESVASSALSYDFTYDDTTGEIATVSKNDVPIEHHAYEHNTSDHTTVMTDQYPPDDDTSNPLYTRISTYDKYGRLTDIQGVLENQYHLSSRFCYTDQQGLKYTLKDYDKTEHGELEYACTNSDGKDAVLSQTTDRLEGERTYYGYYAGKMTAAVTKDLSGNTLRTETFAYDRLGRLIKDHFYHGWVTNESVTNEVQYERAETDPLADKRVKNYNYKVNGIPTAVTQNTYDTYKRINLKKYLIGNKAVNKSIVYSGNRINSTTDSVGGTTSYTYDDLGRITSINDGNPTTYKYNSSGQLNRENNKALDKTFVYQYNSSGGINKIKEYAYTTGSLVGATVSTTSLSYDSTCPDRLTSFGGASVSYNAMGCPTTYNGYNTAWTRGKLSALSNGSALLGRNFYNYSYNAYGQRVGVRYTFSAGTSSSAVAMGTLTGYNKLFSYDQSGRLICESKTSAYYGEGNANEKTIFLYDESGIVGMQHTGSSAAGIYYFHRNLLGDVVGIYNSTGTKVGGYAYDAWGNCTITLDTNGIATKNPIRYRGYYYDQESGLYYLNARYYSPVWRRFISPDDTGYLDPNNINGLNLYSYAHNNPVNVKYNSSFDGDKGGLGSDSATNSLVSLSSLNSSWGLGSVISGVSSAHGIVDKVSSYLVGSVDGLLSYAGIAKFNGFQSQLTRYSNWLLGIGIGLDLAASAYNNYHNPNLTASQKWASFGADVGYIGVTSALAYGAGALVTKGSIALGTAAAGFALGATIGGVTIGFTGAIAIGAVVVVVGIVSGTILIAVVSDALDNWWYQQKEEWFS